MRPWRRLTARSGASPGMEVYSGEKSQCQVRAMVSRRDAARSARVRRVDKGPLGTPIGGGMRSLNVAMRQSLDLYACVRPIRYFPGVSSPMQDASLTDMVIFRENTEDIYAGIEWAAGTAEVHKLIAFLQNDLKATGIRFPPARASASSRFPKRAVNGSSVRRSSTRSTRTVPR